MVSKKEILKNITNYSPEEIADAVRVLAKAGVNPFI